MNETRTNNVRRTASSHLSTLALVGIIATLSLTVMAIWTTHERAQNGNANSAHGAGQELSRQSGS